MFDLTFAEDLLDTDSYPESINALSNPTELTNLVQSAPLNFIKLSVSLKLLNTPESLTALDKKFLQAWKTSLEGGEQLQAPVEARKLKFKQLSARDKQILEEGFGFVQNQTFANFGVADLSFELLNVLNNSIVQPMESLLHNSGEANLSDTGMDTNNYKKFLLDRMETCGWQIGNKWSESEIEDVINLACVSRVDDSDEEYGTGIQNGKYRQSLREFIDQINGLENRNKLLVDCKPYFYKVHVF